MRSGYAWVEVSAQPAGVHSPQGLRNWNPARYGSLDVAVDTIDLEGPLRFDIFLQAVMALKGNPKVQPLGNLHPEFIIATGHSRSAWMLMRRPIEEILDRLHRFHGFPNVQPDPLPLWIRSCYGSSQQMDQTTPVRHTHRNEYR